MFTVAQKQKQEEFIWLSLQIYKETDSTYPEKRATRNSNK